MNTKKRLVLFLLATMFILAVAGCGPSAEELYFEKLQPALDEYNAALSETGTQFGSMDEAALNNQAWMDTTFAALDRLDAAGKALAATPADQVPEKWAKLNGLLVQVSDQTTTFTSMMKDALTTQDTDAMMAALSEFEPVITLFEQALQELNANQ